MPKIIGTLGAIYFSFHIILKIFDKMVKKTTSFDSIFYNLFDTTLKKNMATLGINWNSMKKYENFPS